MSKPTMLILGTGGIAQACVEKFSSNYEIISVSRRTGTIKGDLTDVHFRDSLVESVQPQVIIASYGDWPKNMSLIQTLELYFNSVVDIFEKFEKKGKLEHFVVISSIDAICSSHPLMSRNEFAYTIAKKSLSCFFQQLQLYGRLNSKIVLIEPGYTATDFAQINERVQKKNQDDYIFKLNISVYSAVEVAKQIALSLQSNRSMTVTMHNKFST